MSIMRIDAAVEHVIWLRAGSVRAWSIAGKSKQSGVIAWLLQRVIEGCSVVGMMAQRVEPPATACCSSGEASRPSLRLPSACLSSNSMDTAAGNNDSPMATSSTSRSESVVHWLPTTCSSS